MRNFIVISLGLIFLVAMAVLGLLPSSFSCIYIVPSNLMGWKPLIILGGGAVIALVIMSVMRCFELCAAKKSKKEREPERQSCRS